MKKMQPATPYNFVILREIHLLRVNRTGAGRVEAIADIRFKRSSRTPEERHCVLVNVPSQAEGPYSQPLRTRILRSAVEELHLMLNPDAAVSNRVREHG